MNDGSGAVVVHVSSTAPIDASRCAGHLAEIVRRVIATAVTERLDVRVADVVIGDEVGPSIDSLLDGVPALFGRTVHSRAADVRRRMLDHLGVTPIGRLDADIVADLERLHLTASDWHLIVASATTIGDIDPDLAAFIADPAEADAHLTELVDAIAADPNARTPTP